MRIIKIAGQKIKIRYEIDLKTGKIKMIPQEGFNPNHVGIERLLPTTNGKITPNDPAEFPTQPQTELPIEETLPPPVIEI